MRRSIAVFLDPSRLVFALYLYSSFNSRLTSLRDLLRIQSKLRFDSCVPSPDPGYPILSLAGRRSTFHRGEIAALAMMRIDLEMSHDITI